MRTSEPFASACAPAPIDIVASAMLAMAKHHSLERRESMQCLESFLTSVPRMLDAAERQLDAASRAVIVAEHLAALHGAPHAQLSSAGLRPHACDESEIRRVGEADPVGL